MALPKKLKNFNLFGNGESWLGQIDEVTLPTLARTMEEYRGSGMDGAVDIDMGQEKIEFEWSAGGIITGIYDGYGATELDSQMLRFAGAYVRDDTDETVAVEIVVRGRHQQIDMGTAKAGDDNSISVTTTCSYYKLTIDGTDTVEIDIPGYVFLVNGQDRLAAKRQAMGL